MEENTKKVRTRKQEINKAGIVGILTNVLLAAFKVIVGLLSNSIAIILDALNNLSDALSSIITIVGMKLASIPPNEKHPLGYGRIEYLSATIISGIVIATGVTSFIESIKKIINPVTTNYTLITFIIVGAAIVTKIILGRYTTKVGKKVNSASLIASGADAIFDSVISFSTIVGATITLLWGINIDGFIGAIISLVMIKAGIGMLLETISDALGERMESAYSKKIKDEINKIENVEGAYDLVVHSYGPENKIGSVEIEISDQLSPMAIYRTTLIVREQIEKTFGIILSIGICVKNTQLGPEFDYEQKIRALILKQEHVISIHGFYTDFDRKKTTFHAVLDFVIQDIEGYNQELVDLLKAYDPSFEYMVVMDINYSD